MGSPRQEHWSGLPVPSPGDLPNPRIKPRSPALQVYSLPDELPGKPLYVLWVLIIMACTTHRSFTALKFLCAVLFSSLSPFQPLAVTDFFFLIVCVVLSFPKGRSWIHTVCALFRSAFPTWWACTICLLRTLSWCHNTPLSVLPQLLYPLTY